MFLAGSPVWCMGNKRICINNFFLTLYFEILHTVSFGCDADYNNSPPLIYLALFRIMKLLEMSQVGRYYYDPKRPSPIPEHRLELWPGYITAIQAYEGLFVNCKSLRISVSNVLF